MIWACLCVHFFASQKDLVFQFFYFFFLLWNFFFQLSNIFILLSILFFQLSIFIINFLEFLGVKNFTYTNDFRIMIFQIFLIQFTGFNWARDIDVSTLLILGCDCIQFAFVAKNMATFVQDCRMVLKIIQRCLAEAADAFGLHMI